MSEQDHDLGIWADGRGKVRVDWKARHREVAESVGKRFGMLVIERVDERAHGPKGLHVFARCDCGAEKLMKYRAIKSGNSSTCGTAQHRDWERLNTGREIVGRRFGLLVVIGELAEAAPDRHTQVKVRCDCGAVTLAHVTYLRSGAVVTCRGPAHLTIKPEVKRWTVHGKSSTYVLEAIGTGMIKIGRARDLDARMRKLQATCPVQLVAIAVCDDDIERSLHAQISSHRSHGEWFRKNDETMSAIGERMRPVEIFAPLLIQTSSGGNAGKKYKCKACGASGHQARTCKKLFEQPL